MRETEKATEEEVGTMEMCAEFGDAPCLYVQRERQRREAEMESKMEIRRNLYERINALESQLREANKKAALIDRIVAMLERPKGMHTYTQGIHDGDCKACDLLRQIRGSLEDSKDE